jgi:hypothetical protein
MGKFFSNPYLSDSLSYKEKGFSYGKADSRLFLGIKNRNILVMPLSLYPHILCGYVVYDSSIS